MGTDLGNATSVWATFMKIGALTGCHQKYERSFHLHGFQFPLCARCTGLIVGQNAALISYAFYSHTRISFFFIPAAASVIALGVDGLGQLMGLWTSNNARRLLTGLFCGFFTSAVFFLLLKQLFYFIP